MNKTGLGCKVGPPFSIYGVAMVALAGGLSAGCSQSDVPREQVGKASQPLSVATTRVFGFESLQDWSPLWSTPVLSLSSTHSEGMASLALKGGGWMQVVNHPLKKEDPAPSVVGYDIRVPQNPVNQWWYGSTELSIDAPSVGIWGQYLGHVELTGFPRGQFNRVEFAIPAAIKQKLNKNYTALTFRIVVNVSGNETASYLLDRFTFGPANSTCTPVPDGNPCTDDVCTNGVPTWVPRPAGTSCDTNTTVCDGAGTCSAAGQCHLGTLPVLDDNNPCTTDACDPVTGVVHRPVAAGVSCESDANICNGVSRCNGTSACVAGSPPPVDDNNPCTDDACDVLTGVKHSPKAAGTSCDSDDNVCNGAATCDANAACVLVSPPSVNDYNDCTVDTCDPHLGAQHTAVLDGSACNDGNACTVADRCINALCVPGASRTCAASDQCHAVGVCDALTGSCSNPAKQDNSPCNDGSACTTLDICSGGACVGTTPVVCAATDQCHDAGTCNYVTGICSQPPKAEGSACNDGDACTRTDTCTAGSCVGSAPTICAALDACHDAGTCDRSSGTCTTPPKSDGTPCDDNTVCNGRERCALGACVASTPPAVDDGNPCTADTCEPTTGVKHSPANAGSLCTDGDVCNGAETCDSLGQCQSGAAPPTDDGNPCTVDSCDPITGVVHSPVTVGAACDNNTVCDGRETCSASGACVSGPAPSLDDSNDCTVDMCDAVGGVQHQAVPGGSACNDGNPCTTGEACGDGTCSGGSLPTLDDGNPCTIDSCDPVTGVVHALVPAGTTCAGGTACGGAGTCSASGVCTSQPTTGTDDGNDCTIEVCNPNGGSVTQEPLPGGTPCAELDSCHDIGACDGAGHCNPGAPLDLDDGDPCTVETCDPITGFKRRTCSKLNVSVTTVPTDANEWLYTGNDPLQVGVAPGTIQRYRGSLLKGHVSTIGGQPLAGARVTIVLHPEFGNTVTQTDGDFVMVVNGGGQLSVRVEKDGLLTVDRSTNVPWAGYAEVPPIVLIQADPTSTAIDLSGIAGAFQVAKSSVSSDDDGARQGVLLFPSGTSATMKLADGTSAAISAMSVRITEFTRGANGPAAMPAALPPQSAYTYAFEVNADEAVVAGAVATEFSQPLIYYVDNFLDFPKGTIVPVGSYDRKRSLWVPEKSGRVINIVSIQAGVAQLDIDSDAAVDDPIELAAIGITTAEQLELAELFAPGATLWRVEVPHFTQPYDCNWGTGPGPDTGPLPPQPPPDPPRPDPCEVGNASTVECDNQAVRERVPVAGTPYSLSYSSLRAPGRTAANQLPIQVSGNVVNGAVQRIDLTIEIAGRTFRRNFAPIPNIADVFEWDGRDQWGRKLQGVQTARVTIGFVVPGDSFSYRPTSYFGDLGSQGALAGKPYRGPERSIERTFEARVSGLSAAASIGGWTFNANHTYDINARELLRGDGTRARVDATGLTVDRIPSPPAYIDSIAVDSDGSYYVVSSKTPTVVWKVRRDGVTTRFAGVLGSAGFSGDGGPATEALFNDFNFFGRGLRIALDVDGSLIIADRGNDRLRRVGKDGIVKTIAGPGVPGVLGDGGPATLARLDGPAGPVVAADGRICFIDMGAYAVRCISTDGIIRTVFSDPPIFSGSSFRVPSAIHFDRDGSLLMLSSGWIRRLGPAGITNVVGTEQGLLTCSGGSCQGPEDGALAATVINAGVLLDLAVGQDGTLYWAQDGTNFPPSASRVRMLDANGKIQTLAGGGTVDGASVLARSASLLLNRPISLGPDGLYLSNVAAPLLVVRPGFPGIGNDNFIVASSDGSAVHVFDAGGRHLQDRHGLTGAVTRSFAYTDDGPLRAITDAFGNRTTVERDGSGNPTAIIGPYGQRSDLAIDARGFLQSVTSPDGSVVSMDYTDGGLLTSFTDARGAVSLMTYDAAGRLTSDTDAVGRVISLRHTPTSTGKQVTLEASGQGSTTHDISQTPLGDGSRSLGYADGTSASETSRSDGSITTRLGDGTTITVNRTPDPRWGLAAPIVSKTTVLPSGLTSTFRSTRKVTLANPLDPFSITEIDDQYNVNGATFFAFYIASTKTWTYASPLGRRQFFTINNFGQTTNAQVNGLTGVDLAYDPQGRLSKQTLGTRQAVRKYTQSGPAAGYLQTATDPLLHSTYFANDPLGRVLSAQTPDSATTAFEWDANSNLTSVTPPGRPPHLMDYSPVGLLSEYTPPVLASIADGRTVNEYNIARDIERSTSPDGLVTTYAYDSAGRLNDIQTPAGAFHHDYFPATPCTGCTPGRLRQITSPDEVALSLTYDGPLLTGSTWSGPANGGVAYAYNADFKVKTETVAAANGSSVVEFGYNADKQLTCASPTSCSAPGADALRLNYDFTTGLPSGTSVGTTTEPVTYTSLGELETQSGIVGSANVFGETYDSDAAHRDALGRVKRKRELVNGNTTTWDYTYDLANRLQAVSLNGAPYESYTYDDNGNRLTVANGGASTSATYDAQDRLLTYGPWSYSYTANGELLTKSNATTGEFWSYKYDTFGNLKRVTLPTGDVIEYLIDGQNRRVAKLKNGVPSKQWLYADRLRPVAELDGAGNLLARFVWASGSAAPDLVVASGKTYRLFRDQLGSPRTLVDASSGATAGVMRHDAWGVVLEDSLSSLVPFGFAGGLYDPDTGLVRFGARDYDPQIGRWVSKDPIRFGGHQANLYVYVGNDPVNRIDPSGLQDGMGGASGFGEGGGEGAPGALGDDDGGLVCGGDDDFAKCWEDCMDAQGADYAAGVFVGLSPFAPTPKTAWELGRTMGGGASMTTWASRLSAGLGMAASNSLRSAGAVAGKVSALPYAFAGGYYGGSAAVCSAECG